MVTWQSPESWWRRSSGAEHRSSISSDLMNYFFMMGKKSPTELSALGHSHTLDVLDPQVLCHPEYLIFQLLPCSRMSHLQLMKIHYSSMAAIHPQDLSHILCSSACTCWSTSDLRNPWFLVFFRNSDKYFLSSIIVKHNQCRKTYFLPPKYSLSSCDVKQSGSSSRYLVCFHPGNPSPKCDRNIWMKHITQKAWLFPKPLAVLYL